VDERGRGARTGESARRLEQWDRYWAYGNIHSFSQVSGGNYQGAIADFWKSRFETLESESRILDIATGNGAIALFALESSDQRSAHFEILGVDLADIDPSRQVKDPSLAGKLSRITFQSHVSAESLPVDSDSIDMACSQFGIEYSNLSRSIPELARVLKPSGRAAMIVHHRDSILLRATREELDQLHFVLNDVKLYLRARNLLRSMADVAKGRVAAEALRSPKVARKRRALDEAMERIEQAARTRPNPGMLVGPGRYIQEILSAADRATAVELLRWLDEAQFRVAANQRRLLDMVAAARNDDDFEMMEHLLIGSGLSGVDMQAFRGEGGAMLGWSVEAYKN
jgi:ubiquinone/menaquinone biosynthesis C-methylase UbiE